MQFMDGLWQAECACLRFAFFDSLRGRCYTPPRLERSRQHEVRTIISPSSSLHGQAHGIADVEFVLAQGLVETNQSFFVNVS